MTQKIEDCKPFIVVKIRGTVRAQREVKETLDLLHLTHTNHAVLIDSRPAYKGMLQRINAYVTWGEPSKEMVALLLKNRAKLAGSKKITEEYLSKSGFKTIEDLAQAIIECKVQYGKLPEIEPRFKLRPPSKGFKGNTKKSFNAGGESGYRGSAINELIKRMI